MVQPKDSRSLRVQTSIEKMESKSALYILPKNKLLGFLWVLLTTAALGGLEYFWLQLPVFSILYFLISVFIWWQDQSVTAYPSEREAFRKSFFAIMTVSLGNLTLLYTFLTVLVLLGDGHSLNRPDPFGLLLLFASIIIIPVGTLIFTVRALKRNKSCTDIVTDTDRFSDLIDELPDIDD